MLGVTNNYPNEKRLRLELLASTLKRVHLIQREKLGLQNNSSPKKEPAKAQQFFNFGNKKFTLLRT